MKIRLEAEFSDGDYAVAAAALSILQHVSTRYDIMSKHNGADRYNRRVVKGKPLIKFVNIKGDDNEKEGCDGQG